MNSMVYPRGRRFTERLTISLTPEQLGKLQQMANREGRSKSNMLQCLLEEAAQRRGLEMLAEPQPEGAPA